MSLREAAWRYQADEIYPEDLPMIAAEALAAGLDTPVLCELAGLPRNADARDIHEAFEEALAESGMELPDPVLARRHALRRLRRRSSLTGKSLSPNWLRATGGRRRSKPRRSDPSCR